MITVIKLDPAGQEKIRYQGKLSEQADHLTIIEADWTLPARDLGYTRFEPGDRFVEYYYTDRWFNIFAIASREGTRKGWYCNITEPALVSSDVIRQVDLYLDVWVNPEGQPLILDEDEFVAATMLSDEQREGAQRGLQSLLWMLESRQGAFADLEKR